MEICELEKIIDENSKEEPSPRKNSDLIPKTKSILEKVGFEDNNPEFIDKQEKDVEKVSDLINAPCFDKLVEAVPNLLKQSKFFQIKKNITDNWEDSSIRQRKFSQLSKKSADSKHAYSGKNDNFDYNLPTNSRKDTMYLSTINSNDAKIHPFKKLDTKRDWSINL